jgi:hypothetical protein
MTTISGMSHTVIVKTPGLLPMQYRAREIEEELGISSTTLRGWMRKGLPFFRDSRGHLWIDGTKLAAWIKSKRGSQHKVSMKPGEAFCLRCRRIVRMVDPVITTPRGKQGILSGHCPECNGGIHRGFRNDG